jgi:hypothetical protein
MSTTLNADRQADNVVVIGVGGARRPVVRMPAAGDAPGAMQFLYEMWLAKDVEARRPKPEDES